MLDKFKLTEEQNIFLAKRNIVDYIWKSARLEGIAVTFPQTDAIYNGVNVPELKVDEVVAINNLKHAWQFVLSHLDYKVDFPYLCRINQLVGAGIVYNAGYTRNVPVRINGTTWTPPMPIESQIKEKLLELQEIPGTTERAVSTMLYCMRQQIYMDGNKRTSMLAGNQIMISGGAGIISVPIELQSDFSEQLLKFYATGDVEPIKAFVYEQCIDGMEFPERTPEEQQEHDAMLSQFTDNSGLER